MPEANVERLSSIVWLRCGANVVLVLNEMVLVLVLEMRCETPARSPLRGARGAEAKNAGKDEASAVSTPNLLRSLAQGLTSLGLRLRFKLERIRFRG